jgi:environmental stress-induced protein Ves
MPWKNGGGETAEVAIWPDDAALDAFDWRVSMARVATDGPFSSFAGVDRTLAVLTGGGLRLSVAGSPIVELTPCSLPHRFPGDAATSATLIAGAITDLNVMTRRGRFTHRVRRVEVVAPTSLPVAAWATLIICGEGRVAVTSESASWQIGPLDTLVLKPSDAPVSLTAEPQASILVVELRKS